MIVTSQCRFDDYSKRVACGVPDFAVVGLKKLIWCSEEIVPIRLDNVPLGGFLVCPVPVSGRFFLFDGFRQANAGRDREIRDLPLSSVLELTPWSANDSALISTLTWWLLSFWAGDLGYAR